ncbi:hypothetical protein LEMLEM_LOCUS4533 [Lemmus lemmus]
MGSHSCVHLQNHQIFFLSLDLPFLEIHPA